LTKEELFKIITEIEEAGFHVVSITSDMAPENQSLAKSLGITEENTSFQHPCRDDVIWWFFDVPHLLKLLRNNLLKHGFILPSGVVINKRMLLQLIDKLQGEVRMAPKLTLDLVEVKDQDLQRVYKAARLISRTTGAALQVLFPNDPAMLEMADFIIKADKWFDTLDSRSKYDKAKHVKCGYEVHLEEQSMALNDFKEVINKMVVCSKTKHMPWQTGVIISCESLPGLLDSLKTNYGILYIMTSRVNQDGLENTFCKLRAMGRFYSSFGALSYKHRLKDFILGAGDKLAVETAAVVCNDCDPVLTDHHYTRKFAEAIIVEEEEPVEDINTVLSLLVKIGEPQTTAQKEGFNYFTGIVFFNF
jgi:hypothetical protein